MGVPRRHASAQRISMPRNFVVLGLGSNLGDRLEQLSKAVAGMTSSRTAFLSDARTSEVFESEALLLPDSPSEWNIPFFNIAISGFTGLSPRALLDRIHILENAIGRQKRGRWAPREIDIDILVFGDERLQEEDLKIPHPGLEQRPFALWPLAALAPHYRLPLENNGSITALEACGAWGFQRSAIPCRTWRAQHEIQREFEALLKATHVPVVTGPLGVTELVGIVNVTPDSFSDGGKFLDPQLAVRRSQELFHQGASILDIGAESTRPEASPLHPEEEWSRMAPVLEGITCAFNTSSARPTLSVDTRHAEVAKRALALGVNWVNDVTGFLDREMVAAVAQSSCSIVAMHSLGIPPSKDRVLDRGSSAISQLLKWAEARILALSNAGIDRSRIIIDPGLGFGKTPQQSLEIALNAERFLELGVRILIGHSRKSFLGLFTEATPAARDGETALLTALLARRGIHYLRVHDIAKNVAAIASVLPRLSSENS